MGLIQSGWVRSTGGPTDFASFFFLKWAGPDQPYGLGWNGSSQVRLGRLMAQQAFLFFFFLVWAGLERV
jgi:hypothetical protein